MLAVFSNDMSSTDLRLPEPSNKTDYKVVAEGGSIILPPNGK